MEKSSTGFRVLPVLVIDDVKSARTVMCDMLKELGYTQCLEAKNGVEALKILRATPVQLILCDLQMEQMNGMEFLTYLHKELPHRAAPVIFVSAVGDVSSVDGAMTQGAADYLVKPVSFRKFKRKVELILGYSKTHDTIEQHSG
jgi:two-component system chemotaxis response regulator CheY